MELTVSVWPSASCRSLTGMPTPLDEDILYLAPKRAPVTLCPASLCSQTCTVAASGEWDNQDVQNNKKECVRCAKLSKAVSLCIGRNATSAAS